MRRKHGLMRSRQASANDILAIIMMQRSLNRTHSAARRLGSAQRLAHRCSPRIRMPVAQRMRQLFLGRRQEAQGSQALDSTSCSSGTWNSQICGPRTCRRCRARCWARRSVAIVVQTANRIGYVVVVVRDGNVRAVLGPRPARRLGRR